MFAKVAKVKAQLPVTTVIRKVLLLALIVEVEVFANVQCVLEKAEKGV